jgi:hypothetical protein
MLVFIYISLEVTLLSDETSMCNTATHVRTKAISQLSMLATDKNHIGDDEGPMPKKQSYQEARTKFRSEQTSTVKCGTHLVNNGPLHFKRKLSKVIKLCPN